jgi:hypothetical protein
MMAYFVAGTKCRSPPHIMGGDALGLAAADKVIVLLASCDCPVGWHLAPVDGGQRQGKEPSLRST